MATRTTRMRPLDHNRPLEIIRGVDDLEASNNDEGGLGGRELEQTIEALDKQHDEARAKAKAHQRSSQDIPIPTVQVVGTHNRDYLPTFQAPSNYVHGRGAVGYQDDSMIEYDLDAQDRAWLDSFNRGQNRLPPRRLELFLWRLELANAAATERTLAAAGASQTERHSAAALAAVDHMPAAEALAVVQAAHPGRDVTAQAVYAYWRGRRLAAKKPLLRRLQAPTSASDSNPMLVFRPREKIHRPQTRRRRENNEDSADKLRAIRANLAATRDLCEALTRREQRKLNIVFNDVDTQQLQLKLRHEPQAVGEGLLAEYMAAAKAKPPHRPLGFEGAPSAIARVPATATSFNATAELRRLQKKRKRDSRRPDALAIQQLGPPPLAQDPDMLFAALPDPSRLPQQEMALPACVDRRRMRARIGRGGRLVFDRCDALSLEPLYEPAPEAAAGEAAANAVGRGNNNNAGGGAGPGNEQSGPGPGGGNEKVAKRASDVVKPLWKLSNPYAAPKGEGGGGTKAASAHPSGPRAAVQPSASLPSAAAKEALPAATQMRLKEANAAQLPSSVRAARDAIDSLLVNSGSQARASPLPPQATAQQAPTSPRHLPAPAHAQPRPQQQQQQQPVVKRGPGRPPKLKTGNSMGRDDKSHGVASPLSPSVLPQMEMVGH